MDSQDRLIALDDTMDSETLQHYGVKGMKWGVHKVRKKISTASSRKEVEGIIDGLNFYKSEASKEAAKLKRKNERNQTVLDKRISRDAVKSAKLETKAAKKKRKAAGVFVTDGRAKELMFEAQKLDAKVSTLDARVKKAKAKVDKNKVMMDALDQLIKDIDDGLVEAGKKLMQTTLVEDKELYRKEGIKITRDDYGRIISVKGDNVDEKTIKRINEIARKGRY